MSTDLPPTTDAAALPPESAVSAEKAPFIPGTEPLPAPEPLPSLSSLEPRLAADHDGALKKELLDKLSTARLACQQKIAAGIQPATYKQSEELRLALLLGEEIISKVWDQLHNRK